MNFEIRDGKSHMAVKFLQISEFQIVILIREIFTHMHNLTRIQALKNL